MQGEGYSTQIELGFIDLLSLEPLDRLNRPYRVKEKTFLELLAHHTSEELEPLDRVSEGDGALGITPASSDKRMVSNTVHALKQKQDTLFATYLKAQTVVTEKMFGEMRSITTLKSLADRSLSLKPKEDMITTREHWEVYYIFMSLVKYWHKIFLRMIKTKDKVEREAYERIAGLVYRLIFQKAVGATNAGFELYHSNCLKRLFFCCFPKKKYVKTLWDRIGVEAVAPYAKFDPSHCIWRDYQINERKDRSKFRSMDRIKLLNNLILDSINVYELVANDVMRGFMPLHDYYILYGKSKLDLFEKFPSIQNYSENPDVAEKKAAIFAMLSGMEDMADSADFLTTPLSKKLECRLMNLSRLDIEAIQNYFGEKIALYFYFLSYHTRSMYWIGIFGIIIFIIDRIVISQGFELEEGRVFDANNMTSKDWALVIFKLNRLILSLASVLWSTLYLENWKRKQLLFSIKFGMTDFEHVENKRPNFNGEFIRNLANSAFNIMHYPSMKRLRTTLLTYFVIVLIILLSILIAAACLLVRRTISESPNSSTNSFYVYFLPSLVNYISVKIIEHFYHKIARYFNMKENHETLTKFEDSLINKIFTFNFFNAFNSYFIIGFIKYIETRLEVSYFFGACVNTDVNFRKKMSCFEELQGQTWSFFILTFIFNFFEILWPLIKRTCRKRFRGLPRKYAWGKIDELIEQEFDREEFQATAEIDGVLYDYSEVTLQFASLSFFSVVFPLAFVLSYATSAFEIQVEKLYYMGYIRRPIPRSACDIGNWEYILEGASFFAIFVNAGLIVFTAEGFSEINFILFAKDRGRNIDPFSMQMKYYVFVVFLLLLVKLVMSVLTGTKPESLKTMVARHSHIVGRTIKKPKETHSGGKAGFPMHLLEAHVAMLTDSKKQAPVKQETTSMKKPSISPFERMGTLQQNAINEDAISIKSKSIKEEIGYVQEDFKAD
jgi:anoctamin-10